jgi:hypothetical protein
VINAQLLAIFASLVHISAFLIYNKDIFKGRCNPSPVSWFIWAFMTVVNFTSYKAMNGNWIVAILPTVGSIMCISTFLFLVFSYFKSKEKIKKPDWKDVTHKMKNHYHGLHGHVLS